MNGSFMLCVVVLYNVQNAYALCNNMYCTCTCSDLSCSALQVHRLPNFTPCLLQIVVNSDVPEASRQAGKTGWPL